MNQNTAQPKTGKHFTRRDFLKLLQVASLGVAAASGAGLYVTQIEPGWFDVTQVGLPLIHLPSRFSGFRFAHISDIHLSSWMSGQRVKNIFDTIRTIQPGLVTITGDMVVGFGEYKTTPWELAALEAPLKELTAQFPTLAVLGNHDHYYGASEITDLLERCGVHLLTNEVQKINIDSDVIYFAGLDDVMVKKDRMDEVLAKLPEDACSILLVHEPDYADKSAETGRFDLQISGHSHGGQVNLPFVQLQYFPDLAQKYPRGLYKLGQMYNYTNRGVGMSPPFIRFNCRPEITVYTLYPAGTTGEFGAHNA